MELGMHIYGPLARGKTCYKCDKYIGATTVKNYELPRRWYCMSTKTMGTLQQ
jgi:hypothetical protein